MTYNRPIDTPQNPNWQNAECPLDLIPATADPHGAGQRMVDLCSLPTISQGDLAGSGFGEVMAPYQEALIRYIWGNLDSAGHRKTKTLFLKIGKGAGKSTLVAVLALSHIMDLAMRGAGWRGLIMILSPTIATSDIVFSHLMEFVKLDPELATQFKSNVARRQLTHVASGITCEIAPPRLDATIGRRPLCLIVDEVHACATECRTFAQVLDQARKGGTNAGPEYLELFISTAPPETSTGTYAEMLDLARKTRDGVAVDPDDAFLPILFEWPHDRTDLDIEDPKEWWRGNPGAVPGGTMTLKSLVSEYEAAKRTGVPRNVALFLSQRLGVEPNQSKVGSRTSLQEYWADLTEPTDPSALPCVISIDPGGTDDPAAVCFAWDEGTTGGVALRCKQYITQQGYNRAGDSLRQLYDQAVDANELRVFSSGFEMDEAMMTEIIQFSEAAGSDLVVGGDSFGRAGFVSALQERLWGDFVAVPQGWQLLRAYSTADQLAADGRLHPVKTPLLSANIQNLILEEGPKGRRFAKRDAAQSGSGQLKIDGAMALLGAIELIMEHRKPKFDVRSMIG